MTSFCHKVIDLLLETKDVHCNKQCLLTKVDAYVHTDNGSGGIPVHNSKTLATFSTKHQNAWQLNVRNLTVIIRSIVLVYKREADSEFRLPINYVFGPAMEYEIILLNCLGTSSGSMLYTNIYMYVGK